MPQYRSKPFVVEAFQYFFHRMMPEPMPDWLKEAIDSKKVFAKIYDHELFIDTLEGIMRVGDGDFIVKGVRGELYPCKPDIFLEKHEVIA